MPTRRRTLIAVIASGLVLVVAAGLGGYYLFRPTFRHILGISYCTVTVGGHSVSLDVDQAANASTVAGVALRERMPERAVTVAYAAALQESKLENLNYGDRDSVGIFQQRPSQGWGPARLLEDPVYASRKFFSALAAVPGYRHMKVAAAAQAVQHSADGSAYAQYAAMASVMAAAFTGTAPHAVVCWYAGRPGRPELGSAERSLSRAFGAAVRRYKSGKPGLTVRVPAVEGWAVSAWLVTHAHTFGIKAINCRHLVWLATEGDRGWRTVRTVAARDVTGPGSVLVG